MPAEFFLPPQTNTALWGRDGQARHRLRDLSGDPRHHRGAYPGIVVSV
ncbi:DUF7156 family protein [Mycobacterium marseillense]